MKRVNNKSLATNNTTSPRAASQLPQPGSFYHVDFRDKSVKEWKILNAMKFNSFPYHLFLLQFQKF